MSDFLTTGLSTAVQKKIEDLVLQGKLQGGDKLNEVELAEMFGTSRGPIREACKGLVQAGLLTAVPNRGVFVRKMDVYGWSSRRVVPHGGHQMSLHIAAGLGLGGNESYPGVFQPFGGFSDELSIEDSYVDLPTAPGLGLENKANFRQMLLRAFGNVLTV